MADTTEGYNIVHYLDLLLPALMSLIAGLVIHSFIIGVNVTDWWKGRSVTPVDHIVTSLGISRMGAQCAFTLSVFLPALTSGDLFSVTLDIVYEAYNFFCYANILLTTLFSIVLCLKISNLHTRLFLYLRWMILERAGYFIAAALLLPALSSLISLVKSFTEVTKDEAYNTTSGDPFLDCSSINLLYNYAIETLFPVLFYYISSVLLITSLYHHTTRMKMSSNLSINLETYYSVMRFVSFTFIYKTLYFIIEFCCSFYYHVYHCLVLEWLYIVLEFLPLLHSSYLIYRTAKLRDQMSKVLQNITDFLLQRKNTDTRENIEIVAQ